MIRDAVAYERGESGHGSAKARGNLINGASEAPGYLYGMLGHRIGYVLQGDRLALVFLFVHDEHPPQVLRLTLCPMKMRAARRALT